MPINNTKGFNLAEEIDFIRTRAETVNYFHGMKCTCSLLPLGTNYADPNRGDPSCQACHGLGWVWIPAGQIQGLVSGISQEKDLLLAGIAAPGDLIFSPQIGTNLSEYDKIQLTWVDGMPFEGELITRGTGQTDTAFYGIVNFPQGSCIVVDPITGAITHYNPTTDFT